LTAHGLIDLHLHTTASDGRCAPRELVDRASSAGITVMAVTDHDTTAAVEEVRAHAAERGVHSITGIEITAVQDSRDIHMLGYFFDPSNPALIAFLTEQRTLRLERIETIAARLAELGMPVDLGAVLAEARRETGRSIGRPKVAQAMIAAGYVADVREAFDRWLARGLPAFVPRVGPSPDDVIAVVHSAGGLVSLAHPGRTMIDPDIPSLRDAGLDAIEVYHSDHAPAAVARYRQMAAALDLLVTGGSDFHGYPGHGVEPATASLPANDWIRLETAAARSAAKALR
jgi:3',5'-nucleoside bisphosphate phosphatase